jgi:hypothetical protein
MGDADQRFGAIQQEVPIGVVVAAIELDGTDVAHQIDQDLGLVGGQGPGTTPKSEVEDRCGKPPPPALLLILAGSEGQSAQRAGGEFELGAIQRQPGHHAEHDFPIFVEQRAEVPIHNARSGQTVGEIYL